MCQTPGQVLDEGWKTGCLVNLECRVNAGLTTEVCSPETGGLPHPQTPASFGRYWVSVEYREGNSALGSWLTAKSMYIDFEMVKVFVYGFVSGFMFVFGYLVFMKFCTRRSVSYGDKFRRIIRFPRRY